MSKKPKIAVSGCLLGQEIRFNGQHKRHIHLTQELSEMFQYETFCPEVSMGLGIPREPIHLIIKEGETKLVNTKDNKIDHTELAKKTIDKLLPIYKDVSGFVLMKASPTCGYDPIKTYTPKKTPSREKRQGVWAEALTEAHPLIPKIDSGRLFNDMLRSTFVSQVYIYDYWKRDLKTPKQLVQFHAENKFYLLQYGPVALKKLGKLCAGVNKKNFKEKHQEYGECLFGEVFHRQITDKARNNVLEHMAGFFKDDLEASDKKYLHDNIMRFHKSKLSFESVMNLIEFLAKSYRVDYISQQKIFEYYKS